MIHVPRRRSMRALVLAIALAAGPAAAAPPGQGIPGLPPPSAAGPDAGKAHFEAGVAAFKADRLADALEAAGMAYAAGHGPDALELAAVVALRVGRIELARRCYTALRTEPAATAGIRSRAEKQLAALEAQVGRIGVTLEPPGAGGAQLTLDGADVGTIPLDGPLVAMPGTHAVEALFADGTRQSRTVRLARGQRVEVVLRAAEDAPAPPPVAAVAPVAPVAATPPPVAPRAARAVAFPGLDVFAGQGALPAEARCQPTTLAPFALGVLVSESLSRRSAAALRAFDGR